MIDAFMGALGLTKGATVGGFLGALVSLKFIERLNLWQGALTVFGGMLCAAYTTPLVMEIVEMKPRTEGAIAFLIGVFGMSIVAAVTKAVPEFVTAVKDRISK